MLHMLPIGIKQDSWYDKSDKPDVFTIPPETRRKHVALFERHRNWQEHSAFEYGRIRPGRGYGHHGC